MGTKLRYILEHEGQELAADSLQSSVCVCSVSAVSGVFHVSAVSRHATLWLEKQCTAEHVKAVVQMCDNTLNDTNYKTQAEA